MSRCPRGCGSRPLAAPRTLAVAVWAALALAPALLAGCAVGPNYHAPAAPKTRGFTPDTLPGATEATAVTGGEAQHFAEVFGRGKADAALAASIFHFGVTDSRELKGELAKAGVSVRLPC